MSLLCWTGLRGPQHPAAHHQMSEQGGHCCRRTTHLKVHSRPLEQETLRIDKVVQVHRQYDMLAGTSWQKARTRPSIAKVLVWETIMHLKCTARAHSIC